MKQTIMLMFFFLALTMSACELFQGPTPCVDTIQCKQKGLCHEQEDSEACIAKTDEDCKKSRFCFSLGLCSYQDGTCVAKTENDCRASEQCTVNRRCIPDNGQCSELTEGWCRRKVDLNNQPTSCQLEGKCSLDSVNHACIARNEKDCLNSTGCKNEGKCSLENGTCSILSSKDCAQSELCKKSGQCHFEEKVLSGTTSRLRQCVALSQIDCDLHCGDQNGCLFDIKTNKCVPGTTFCKDNDYCTVLGHCSWDKSLKKCIVGSDADCKQSQQCIEAARCKKYKGTCVHEIPDPCEEKDDCVSLGKCTTKQGACVPGSDVDCSTSALCLNEGKCSLDSSKDVCMASKTEDCHKSGGCKKQGNCTLHVKTKTCLPASSLDCGQSLLCRTENKCDYFEGKCIRSK